MQSASVYPLLVVKHLNSSKKKSVHQSYYERQQKEQWWIDLNTKSYFPYYLI